MFNVVFVHLAFVYFLCFVFFFIISSGLLNHHWLCGIEISWYLGGDCRWFIFLAYRGLCGGINYRLILWALYHALASLLVATFIFLAYDFVLIKMIYRSMSG